MCAHRAGWMDVLIKLCIRMKLLLLSPRDGKIFTPLPHLNTSNTSKNIKHELEVSGKAHKDTSASASEKFTTHKMYSQHLPSGINQTRVCVPQDLCTKYEVCVCACMGCRGWSENFPCSCDIPRTAANLIDDAQL
jgi:hypothetical protein